MSNKNLSELREQLLRQRVLNEQAEANNTKIYEQLQRVIAGLDTGTLARLEQNGFDAMFLASIDVLRLNEAEYLKGTKEKIYSLISEVTKYLEENLVN